jgi:hypothetical protein
MLTREHFRLSGFQDASPFYEVDALFDPDQLQLTIPRWMANDLGLRKMGKRSLHRGSREQFDYVGAIRLEGRDCESCVSALVKGDEVVMGWLPLSSLVKVINMRGIYSHRGAAE